MTVVQPCFGLTGLLLLNYFSFGWTVMNFVKNKLALFGQTGMDLVKICWFRTHILDWLWLK
jgi:hypothetical protein